MTIMNRYQISVTLINLILKFFKDLITFRKIPIENITPPAVDEFNLP